MKCTYCNKEALFITSKEFYGRDYGTNLYVCYDCDARVGTHKRTKEPKGTLANKELRELRIQCHNRFDVLWKEGSMTRKESYKVLQDMMGMTKKEAHIGQFNKEDCKKLLGLLTEIGM